MVVRRGRRRTVMRFVEFVTVGKKVEGEVARD